MKKKVNIIFLEKFTLVVRENKNKLNPFRVNFFRGAAAPAALGGVLLALELGVGVLLSFVID